MPKCMLCGDIDDKPKMGEAGEEVHEGCLVREAIVNRGWRSDTYLDPTTEPAPALGIDKRVEDEGR